MYLHGILKEKDLKTDHVTRASYLFLEVYDLTYALMMPRSSQPGTSDPIIGTEEASMDVGPDPREVEQEGYGEWNRFARDVQPRTNRSPGSLFDPDIISDMDILVLRASGTRVFLGSQRRLHRRRLQLDWAEQFGPFLERGHGNGARCRARCAELT